MPFAESPKVVRTIGARLVDGQTVTAHGPSFGERIGLVVGGVAQTAGAAETAAVAIPAAVIDAEARRTRNDHLDAIVRGLRQEPTAHE